MATVTNLGYFPEGVCIEESDGSEIWPNGEIPGTENYMVGMSLEEAMATYWKVREWEVYAGNSELEIDVGATLIESEQNGVVNNEKDLVCGNGGFRLQYAIPPYEDPNSIAETISLNIYIHFPFSASLYYNGLYYPWFSFFWSNNPAPITNIGQISGEPLRFFSEIFWEEEGVKWRVEVFPKTYWPYNP